MTCLTDVIWSYARVMFFVAAVLAVFLVVSYFCQGYDDTDRNIWWLVHDFTQPYVFTK